MLKEKLVMDDSVLYEYALEEVESDSKATGLWAKAIANSDGNTDKAKSLYMKYRVDGIRDEFDSFGIDYSELTVAQVASYVEGAFRDEKWRNKIISDKEEEKNFQLAQEENERRNKEKEISDRKQQEKLDAEKEKYSKIGGWLTPFAFFLVIWIIGSLIHPFYTITEGMDDIQSLLLAGEAKFVRIIQYEFYLSLVWQFFVLLLGLFFFDKLKGTKNVAIVFFVSTFFLSIGNALLTFGVATTEFSGVSGIELLEHGELGAMVVLPILLFFLGIISITYFLKSKRVEKTFTEIRYSDDSSRKKGIPKDNTDLFIYALILPVFFLLVYHARFPDSNDIAAINDKKADQTIERANKAFDNQNFDEAIPLYKAAIHLGRNDAKFRLAYSYNEIEEYDLAIRYYKESNEDSQWAGTLHNLSRVYMVGKNDCNNTITYAREANVLDSKYGNFELGYCHNKLGYHKAAIKYYKRHVSENPDDNQALINMAIIYYDAPGEVDQDLKAFFRLILKAARNGDKRAMEAVSRSYYDGTGTEINIDKAKYWERKYKG